MAKKRAKRAKKSTKKSPISNKSPLSDGAEIVSKVIDEVSDEDLEQSYSTEKSVEKPAIRRVQAPKPAAAEQVDEGVELVVNQQAASIKRVRHRNYLKNPETHKRADKCGGSKTSPNPVKEADKLKKLGLK